MYYKNNEEKYIKNKGMALVEIIVGSAIILSVILATTEAYNTYIIYSLSNQNNTRANYILEEGVEVMSFLRDQSWSSNITPLISGSSYYLYFNGSTWMTTTTPQYVGGEFSRNIIISDVSRDSNDDISVSGTNDPNTKKLTVAVSYWQGHSTTTLSLATYLTNINDN